MMRAQIRDQAQRVEVTEAMRSRRPRRAMGSVACSETPAGAESVRSLLIALKHSIRLALTRVVAAAMLATAACDSSCSNDGDCGNGEFCDRPGTCEEVKSDVRYGTGCDESSYDGMDRDLNSCAAYVCRESRCRSCQSDAECVSEHGAPACTQPSVAGWPGLSCGVAE
jgi:hypothetical protein